MQAQRMLMIQNNLFPVDFSPSCVAMAPHVKRAAVIFGASAALVSRLDLYSQRVQLYVLPCSRPSKRQKRQYSSIWCHQAVAAQLVEKGQAISGVA